MIIKNILFLILFAATTFAQYPPVKSELRGAWIASLGIDWPGSTGTSASVIQNQKDQLITILNAHKAQGLNSVFFHVRPLCDAIYKSNYEPWSVHLTGKQGAAPSDTSYDPLKFAIEEAHKRGMELHAWLNPYRALQTSGNVNSLAANHIIKTHPEWIIKCNGTEYRFLNPGLPEVREYVLNVVMDIVDRYDVDGIHFDDYFYPYTDYGSFNDDNTYNTYSYGITSRSDWRKNNVNLLLKLLGDSIYAAKPYVKFGISPSGNPSVNNSIYCDPNAWLSGTFIDSTGTAQKTEPYIDYILPQLYWVGYNGNLPTWSKPSTLNGRQLYVGHAAYRLADEGWSPYELGNQIKTNRNTPTVNGSVYFSSKSLNNNYAGSYDTLQYNYYVHPAITPKMEWKNLNSAPNAPSNLRMEKNTSNDKYEFIWDKPTQTNNGDTAYAYIVYRSETSSINIEDANKIFGYTGELYLASSYAKYSVTKGNYYAVSAIDRNSNESILSNVFFVDSTNLVPGKPILVSPSNGYDSLGYSSTLTWQTDPLAERYLIQVSTDSNFAAAILLNIPEYKTNSIKFTKVQPGKTYYWRVKSFGVGGDSEFSKVYSFESGIPEAPVLAEPAHGTYEVSLQPKFTWFKNNKASTYKIQVATTVQFYDNSIVLTHITNDTSYSVTSELEPNKIHHWRLSATNNFGTSPWSEQNGFKTKTITDVKDDEKPVEYKLAQNYPNPFNPSTIINYDLKDEGEVKIAVYDILGNEILTLVNEYKPAGKHSVEFNLDKIKIKISSGIYFYTLNTGNYHSTKKMIVLK